MRQDYWKVSGGTEFSMNSAEQILEFDYRQKDHRLPKFNQFQQYLWFNLFMNTKDKVITIRFPRRAGKTYIAALLSNIDGVYVFVPTFDQRKPLLQYGGNPETIFSINESHADRIFPYLHTIVLDEFDAMKSDKIKEIEAHLILPSQKLIRLGTLE